MLYDRDYNFLTDDETDLWKKAEKLIQKQHGMTIITGERLAIYHQVLPIAVYHYQSLFPNNFLNLRDLDDSDRIIRLRDKFISLLDRSCTERDF